MRDEHPTVTRVVDGEEIQVDEKIAPLVDWMNALFAVSTLFSCQGPTLAQIKSKKTFVGSAYVLFRCYDHTTLEMIAERVMRFNKRHRRMIETQSGPELASKLELTMPFDWGIRYCLSFPTRELMEKFTSRYACLLTS